MDAKIALVLVQCPVEYMGFASHFIVESVKANQYYCLGQSDMQKDEIVTVKTSHCALPLDYPCDLVSGLAAGVLSLVKYLILVGNAAVEWLCVQRSFRYQWGI